MKRRGVIKIQNSIDKLVGSNMSSQLYSRILRVRAVSTFMPNKSPNGSFMRYAFLLSLSLTLSCLVFCLKFCHANAPK